MITTKTGAAPDPETPWFAGLEVGCKRCGAEYKLEAADAETGDIDLRPSRGNPAYPTVRFTCQTENCGGQLILEQRPNL